MAGNSGFWAHFVTWKSESFVRFSAVQNVRGYLLVTKCGRQTEIEVVVLEMFTPVGWIALA